jgi:ABC-type multidrug transport system fused ATPase/permease subunit
MNIRYEKFIINLSVILDEATSALDNESEKLILNAIRDDIIVYHR